MHDIVACCFLVIFFLIIILSLVWQYCGFINWSAGKRIQVEEALDHHNQHFLVASTHPSHCVVTLFFTSAIRSHAGGIYVGLQASLWNWSLDPNYRNLFGCKSCIMQGKATSEDAYLQRNNALFSNHTLAWTVSTEIYCTLKPDVRLKRNHKRVSKWD